MTARLSPCTGSPILDATGMAIGVVTTGVDDADAPRGWTKHGPQARLSQHLSGWMLRLHHMVG